MKFPNWSKTEIGTLKIFMQIWFSEKSIEKKIMEVKKFNYKGQCFQNEVRLYFFQACISHNHKEKKLVKDNMSGKRAIDPDGFYSGYSPTRIWTFSLSGLKGISMLKESQSVFILKLSQKIRQNYSFTECAFVTTMLYFECLVQIFLDPRHCNHLDFFLNLQRGSFYVLKTYGY